MANLLKRALSDALRQFQGVSPKELIKQRHERIMNYGKFKEIGQA
jgi:acetyl-CoA carboxylase carboxyl transferase subunit alpha